MVHNLLMTCKDFTRLSFRLVSPPTIATPNNNLLNTNFLFKEQRVWLARLIMSEGEAIVHISHIFHMSAKRMIGSNVFSSNRSRAVAKYIVILRPLRNFQIQLFHLSSPCFGKNTASNQFRYIVIAIWMWHAVPFCYWVCFY